MKQVSDSGAGRREGAAASCVSLPASASWASSRLGLVGRGPCLLGVLGFLLAIASLLASGAVHAQGGGETGSRPPCDVCSGTGRSACKRCAGTKSVQLSCLICEGAAQIPCPRTRCKGGSVVCVVCNGQGGETKRSVSVFGGPSERRTKICPHCFGARRVDCWRCEAGTAACDACTGSGKAAFSCPDCGATGTTRCSGCQGSGRGGRLPLHATTLASLESLRASAARLAVQISTGAARPVVSSGVDHAQRVAELEALAARASRVRESLSPESPENDRLAASEAVLTSCTETLKELERGQNDLVALDAGARTILAALASVDREIGARIADGKVLDGVPPVEEIALYAESVGVAQTFLEETRGSAELVSRESATFETNTGAARKRLDEFDAMLARAAELAAEQSREAAAMAEAFGRIEASVRELARDHGLPEPDPVELADRRSLGPDAPAEIHVDVLFTLPGDAPAHEPDEARDEDRANDESRLDLDPYTEPLPGFVEAVLESDDAISSLAVRLAVPRLDEFGHPEPRTVQSFRFRRSDFERLRTGVYRDDWRMILSRSDPRPDYSSEAPPRDEAEARDDAPSGGWGGIVVGLIAVLVLAGGGIFLVLRARR